MFVTKYFNGLSLPTLDLRNCSKKIVVKRLWVIMCFGLINLVDMFLWLQCVFHTPGMLYSACNWQNIYKYFDLLFVHVCTFQLYFSSKHNANNLFSPFLHQWPTSQQQVVRQWASLHTAWFLRTLFDSMVSTFPFTQHGFCVPYHTRALDRDQGTVVKLWPILKRLIF